MKPKHVFRVMWSVIAREDLRGIAGFIAEDDDDAALAVVRKLREHAVSLSTFPERGRVVPELRQHGILSYRELIVAPWRVVYRIDGKTVSVTAVLDGRRNLEDLLLERLTRP